MSDLMPREKALKYGIKCLEDNELLALILKSGYKNKDVIMLSKELIENAGGINNLFSYSYDEFLNIKGLGKAKALELISIIEICRRLSFNEKVEIKKYDSPDKLVSWIRFNLAFSTRETFFMIYLNRGGKIIRSEELYKGTSFKADVEINEVVRKVLISKASNVIIAHNHPSGNDEPSRADIEITNRLKDALMIINIPLVDHIIVTKESFFSFRQANIL